MKSIMFSMVVALLVSVTSVSAHAHVPVNSGAATHAPSAAAMHAQSGGQIASAVAVTDPTFGVHANVLGLERRVAMLQWRKVAFPAPPHYEQAWSAERIDSSGFDAAHRNGGDLPFNGERWWSADPKLDGHPVAADVMSALDAWAPLKPDLSQIPTNLAVSFQPDGEWLSTSQDPVHPQVGDVRVRWRAMVHASMPPGAALIAGRWEMPPPVSLPVASAVASSAKPEIEESSPIHDVNSWTAKAFGGPLAWWIAGGIGLVLLLVLWRRRR